MNHNHATSSAPPNNAHSQYPHLDLLIEKQDARLDQRFEALKGQLTEWFAYMSNSNMRQVEQGISEGFAAIRGELAEDRARTVAALDALTTSVEGVLQKLPRE